MDMNVIKEYVISLGFKFNEDTYNQFQQTMKNAEGNIKNFANNNKDNMSSLQKFFKLFNGSLKDSMGMISKILPEAKAPFLQLIALVELLHKGALKVSRGFKEVKTDNLKDDNIKKVSETMKDLSKRTKETETPVNQLMDLIKELNNRVNKLSNNFNNINLDKLRNQEGIKEASDNIEGFSQRIKGSQIPIVNLMGLVKELNIQIDKLSSFIPEVTLKGDATQALKEIDKISKAMKDLNIKVNEFSFKLKEIKGPDISMKTPKISGEYQDEINRIFKMLVVLNNRTDEFASKLKNINISNISTKIPDIRGTPEKLNKPYQNLEKNGKTRENNLYINQAMDLYRKLELGINKLIENFKNIKTPRDNFIQQNSQIPNKENKNNFKNDFAQSPTYIENTSKALKTLSKNSDNANDSMKLLAEGGSKSLREFAQNATKFLGVVAVAVAGIVTVAVSSWKTLTSMANQDLEYQKLAMQLWTTNENAKEVDMALKTMKISMQDLWLSPELLQQFNQLRQDSAQLKLPVDAEDKLKLVRSIVFEFKRLKQAGSLAFQWIGYYISKYAGGPLADMHQALNKFVNWVLKNIPEAAKIIGTILGVLFRLILDAIQTIGIVLKPIINTISFIIEVIGKIPAPLKAIIALVIALEIALSTGPLGILLLIIAALDDIFTYFRGGKSVIGSFFDKFKEGANAIKDIKNGWNDFWGGIENFIDRIREKVKKLIKEIKDIPIVKGINDIKNLPGDIKSKVEGFVGSIKKGASSIKSYILPQSNTVNNKNSTSSQTNHNNTTNTFNIYGTNATSTANAVNNKINNGIKTRNLQGVIG